MMKNAEYRSAYPEETQGVSDFDLATALHQQHGGGAPFDQFARDFLVPAEAGPSVPDRTPTVKPAVPPKGAFGSIVDHIQGTAEIAASSFVSGAGGFLRRSDNLINSISDAQDAVFGAHWVKGGGFDRAAKYLLENGDALRKAAAEHGPGFADEMVGEAIGGAVPGIFEFMLGVPWATMTGASEAHQKGNSEIVGGLSHGIKQYVLQRIFGGIGGLDAGKLAKGAITGTVFGLDSAIEGGDKRDFAKAFGTGMLYQFIPGGPGSKKAAAEKQGREMAAEPMKFGAEGEPAPAEAPPASARAEAEAQIMKEGVSKEEPPPHTPAEKEVIAAEGTVIEPPAPDTIHQRIVEQKKLFHGTGAEFDKFDTKKASPKSLFGPGLIFLTENPDLAGEYAIQGEKPNIRPVALDMKNPMDMDKPPDPKLLDMYVTEKAAEEMNTWNRHMGAEEGKLGKTDAEIIKEKEAMIRQDIANGAPSIPTNMKLYQLMFNQLGGDMPARLQSLGYDGITHLGGHIVGNVEHRVYASWDASQIKPWFDAEAVRRGKEQSKSLPEDVDSAAGGALKPAERRSAEDLQKDSQFQADAAALRSAALRNQSDEMGEGSGIINLDRMGKTPNDVKRLLDEVAKQRQAETQKASGQTTPNAGGKPVRPLAEIKAEALKLAKSVGMEDRKDFVDSLERDAKNMEERMVMARQILADQGVLVDKMLKEGQAGDKLSMVRFFQELDFFNEIMPVVLGARGHIARATTSGRIPVNGKLVDFKEITPEVAKSLEVSTKIGEILLKLGGEDAFAKVAKDWEKKKDVAAKIKYVRQQRGGKTLNALLEFRATNMLSSINTQLVNNTSNITRQMIDNFVENPIASILGHRDREVGQDRMTMEEAKFRAFGFSKYMFNAFRAIPGALKSGARAVREHGVGAFEEFNKVAEASGPDPLRRNKQGGEGYVSAAISREYLQDTSGGQAINKMGKLGDIIWKGVDTYGSIARALSFGGMNLSDNFFKDVAYKTEVDGLLFREALKRGVGDGSPDKAVEMDNWINKQSELVNGYSQGKELQVTPEQQKFILGMHDAALKRARDATWQRDLTGATKRIEQALKEAPAWRFIIPFYKTPVNLLAWIPEHTPGLHLLSGRMKDAIAKGGVERDQAHAKLITGSLLYAAAGSLFANGMITGASDPKELHTNINAQIQDYSIFINGKWYQYNRTDPFGFMLGMVADLGFLATKAPDMQAEQITAGVILALGSNVLSKTWATTLSDIFSLTKEPQRYQEGFFAKYGSTLLPIGGLARSINERIDPSAREARGMLDVIQNTYHSEGNAVKLDDFGEPVPATRRLMGVMVKEPRQDSPVRMEMAYLHIPTQMPKDKLIHAADLTDPQFYKFRQNLHELGMEKQMNDLVSSEGYAATENLETRRNILTDFRNEFHAAARAMLFEDPEVVKAYEAEIIRFAARYQTADVHDPKARVEDWRKFLTEGFRPR
jgi:hypothetical protein